MRPDATSTRAEAMSGNIAWARISSGPWKKGSAALGLVQIWPRRIILVKCRRVGPGISRLGRQCQSCAAYHRWYCAYAERWGKQMTPAIVWLNHGFY